MDTNERIIKRAGELFSQYGIQSVRTDDISNELGISKKTFYKYFVSKEELVICVTHRLLESGRTRLEKSIITCDNSIMQAQAIWETLHTFCMTNNPNFMMDVQKYYHRAWDMIENFKLEFLGHILTYNLKKGIEQKLYRSDMNANIMSNLWLDLCQLSYMQTQSGAEIIAHFIRGLLTVEGLENYSIYFADFQLTRSKALN